jgi:hypothetical protein
MLVKMQPDNSHVLGLNIGRRNVKRYIPASIRAIDLELDHLSIQRQDFWHDNPKISDPRLCIWLETKRSFSHSHGLRSMVPLGRQSFKLEPICSRKQRAIPVGGRIRRSWRAFKTSARNNSFF